MTRLASVKDRLVRSRATFARHRHDKRALESTACVSTLVTGYIFRAVARRSVSSDSPWLRQLRLLWQRSPLAKASPPSISI